MIKRSLNRVEAEPGTRAGLHGQTLVSTGLADLDKLLDGGLCLGTLCVVEEDLHSQNHLILARYFAAEGVACKQRTRWLTAAPNAPDMPDLLPLQLLPGSRRPQEGLTSAAAAGKEPELRIAWQYRKYLNAGGGLGLEARAQAPQTGHAASGGKATPARSSGTGQAAKSAGSAALRAGLALVWCHDYDLTKRASEEQLQGVEADVSEVRGPHALRRAAADALSFVLSYAPPEGAQQEPPLMAAGAAAGRGVARLVLESVGAPEWFTGGGSAAAGQQAEEVGAQVCRLVAALRMAVLDSRSTVLITLPAGILPQSCVMRIRHLCDTVLTLHSVSDASPAFQLLPDKLSACGWLRVLKLPLLGVPVPRRPDSSLHVLRNHRRRVAISPVDMDPDAEEGAAAAGAATLCGTGGTPTSSQLDF